MELCQLELELSGCNEVFIKEVAALLSGHYYTILQALHTSEGSSFNHS